MNFFLLEEFIKLRILLSLRDESPETSLAIRRTDFLSTQSSAAIFTLTSLDFCNFGDDILSLRVVADIGCPLLGLLLVLPVSSNSLVVSMPNVVPPFWCLQQSHCRNFPILLSSTTTLLSSFEPTLIVICWRCEFLNLIKVYFLSCNFLKRGTYVSYL